MGLSCAYARARVPDSRRGRAIRQAHGSATMVVYGGTPLREQKQALTSTRPSVVVATPGRLVDLLEQGALSLASCDAIVLDEAAGFSTWASASSRPPTKRCRRAASAALYGDVAQGGAQAGGELPARRRDNDLVLSGSGAGQADGGGEVSANGAGGAAGGHDDCELSANIAVSQSFVQATDDEKDAKLWNLLSELEEGSRVIVFANTKRRVDNLAKTFYDFGTCAIHGDRSQKEREAALASFIANTHPLMVATDVAARGLDIKLVTHVINYDMARDVEDYVHRIGRTGRAGAVGTAITFWNPDYDKECSPALIKIARRAGQPVPDWLAKHEGGKANKLWAVAKAEKEVELGAGDWRSQDEVRQYLL